ncbi:MAG TPA: glycosyltransferase [Ktedonobacteraceae bacterium]|nr:glycosyltransferase [Ktedonobacteraceae bacterium]
MKVLNRLNQYEQFVGEDTIARIHQMAQTLKGLHVLHINTTARGGGVAELLRGLIPLMEELGVQHTWKVIQLDPDANRFTTRLVDMLQGGEPGEISPEEQRLFLNKLQQDAAQSNIEQEHSADIYYVHDFQLVPLARLYPWINPALWYCHVDTAKPNPHAKAYVMQFLDPYKVCTFNSPESVFPELPLEKPFVSTLGIDPLDPKHQYISPEEGRAIFSQFGIDPTRPLISQISRFDRWKNPRQVIDVYRIVKRQIPGVQVALVGAMEATDDIRAMQVLKAMQEYAGNDPDIHLLYDPTQIKRREVDAFQSFSSVILQRSTREGFGLTATEAMWKYQPVIGTSATGLTRQIIHEQTGYIVDDTEPCAQYTLRLLQDRQLWQKLGQQAHDHVQSNFLLPHMLLSYIQSLQKARGL